MNYRRAQAAVAVVTAHKIVERFALDPPLRPGLSQVRPGKWVLGVGLVQPVHPHRVVSRGPAKMGTIRPVANILKGSRIDDQILPFPIEAQTQSISMAVTSGGSSLAASINYHLLTCLRIRQQVQPGTRKRDRLPGRLNRRQLIEANCLIRTQQPYRLFPKVTCHEFEIPTLEQNSSRCQRIRQVFAAIAQRIEHASSVVVAKPGRYACASQPTESL